MKVKIKTKPINLSLEATATDLRSEEQGNHSTFGKSPQNLTTAFKRDGYHSGSLLAVAKSSQGCALAAAAAAHEFLAHTPGERLSQRGVTKLNSSWLMQRSPTCQLAKLCHSQLRAPLPATASSLLAPSQWLRK